jgi:hypothetical protein
MDLTGLFFVRVIIRSPFFFEKYFENFFSDFSDSDMKKGHFREEIKYYFFTISKTFMFLDCLRARPPTPKFFSKSLSGRARQQVPVFRVFELSGVSPPPARLLATDTFKLSSVLTR